MLEAGVAVIAGAGVFFMAWAAIRAAQAAAPYLMAALVAAAIVLIAEWTGIADPGLTDLFERLMQP